MAGTVARAPGAATSLAPAPLSRAPITSGRPPRTLQTARVDQQSGIAVADPARAGDEQRAIGIAVESHTQLGMPFQNGPAQVLKMEGTAVQVDVAPVR